MTQHRINDLGDFRKYYTQVPNVIDDSGLSLIAFRLYVHLKRVAGDEGACFQSSGTLATACNISMGAVSKAKEELVTAGLIEITVKKDSNKAYHEITITDVWAKNIEKYRTSLSLSERLPSPGERLPSPGETKNNPVNNNLLNNNDTPAVVEGETITRKSASPSHIYEVAMALSTVTGMPFDKNRGRLFREAKVYKTAEELAQLIHDYSPGGPWYKQDWRGKKGEKPNTSSIRETWGLFGGNEAPPTDKPFSANNGEVQL